MAWNTWIVSIEIVRKCLFNTRLFSFYFHLYLLRNSKVLFARAQRGKVIIFRIVRRKTNVGPFCIMACGWFFRRTSLNSIPTLVHPLVLQLREYPLKSPSPYAISMSALFPLFSFPPSCLLFPQRASLHPSSPHLKRVCVAWC